MRRIHSEASDSLVIENGLARYDRPGHTRQIAHLPYCHEGRVSAGYYALGRLANADGPREREAGTQTLQALAELQLRNSANDRYGAFRWYAEEAEVQDTNAAFFILMPLVSLRLRAPDAMPDEHVAIMDGMLRRAAFWFERECREPELYYPNKTMSDGAMLLAIAHLLGDGERLEAAADYFERWESYTSRRGWGWGENMSLVYQGVMLNALAIAEPLLRPLRPALAEKLALHRRSLLDILRFHDGRELVPTIRSYNFGGEVLRPSLAWLIAGVTGTDELEETSFHVNDLSTLLLFDPAFQASGSKAFKQNGQDLQNANSTVEAASGNDGRASRSESVADDTSNRHGENSGVDGDGGSQAWPRVREERVFDAAAAYSWIGRRTRLGSLNEFPVMPGSYQHETWGLGWQCFPLSAAAETGQVSYARWYVDDGETVRTHPAESYKTAYLMPALFRRSPYPQVRTFAAQREYALLALRVLEQVNQPIAEIADEWLVPGFAGQAAEIPGADGRLWHVLRYDGAAIAVSPLQTRHDAKCRPGALLAARDGERLRLRQMLHAGASGEPDLPRVSRIEAGWVVVCLDDVGDEAAIEARLSRISIEDEVLDDREVPREAQERIRRVRLLEQGSEQVRLELDPHRSGCT